MAKSEVQRCLDWLFQKQSELETESFGKGRQGVVDALSSQRARTNDIHNFRSKIDKLVETEKLAAETAKDLDGNYNSVSSLSKKRQQCLETVAQIASLEEFIQNMATEFDSRALHLVSKAEVEKQTGSPDQSNESLAKASQTCIQAVRANWQWLFQVMQCAEVHLRNDALYQEFFHEVEEAEYWMETTLTRIHLSFDRNRLQGNRADAEAIQEEINDVLQAFLLWQTKIDYLFDRAKQVVPVPQRVKGIKEPRPVLALTDFDNSEIKFIEGEALTLLDNSDRSKWKVRNSEGKESLVPAVIILIPPPSGEAMDAAIRLRVQLLSLWTTSVKRLGYQLIAFMLLVFRDWNDEETALLQQLSPEDKVELLRVIKYIESTLQEHWQEYGDFQELQERILRLRMIIEEAPEGRESNTEFLQTVVVQIKTLEDLLKKYKDFWAFWETFKVIVELLKQPKFLLVCDKWDQLKYITTAHFVRFLDVKLDAVNGKAKKEPSSMVLQEKNMKPGKFFGPADRFWDTNLDIADGDLTKQTASLVLQEAPSEELVSSEVIISEEKEETTTDTLTTSLEEEQSTFIITGVLDPRDNESKLTLQEAIMLGVVDQAKGLYRNPLTGSSMTMTDAMSDGRVLLEIVSKKKIREEKNSYGIITIKITRETRPYTITGVVDPHSETILSVTQAVHDNILDTHNSTYKTETGELISISDAIASGLVHVDYHEDPNAKPEVVSKTYTVHGVVDTRRKQKVSFSDAVRLGLLDRDTGEYINNVTHQKVGVQEAIMRGFIKARVVADPSKLEVDPRNQIVVQKLESAKEKLKKGVRAIKQFKALGKPL
ncbi:microtubule-actin cross-linking factor 1-like isoform X5 [Pomacea canaliculata]|nr:microtubule-actin cross-linking factor 1-like isoform X5 [Pomacea canaliculata]XP_025079156.1 microtubule-actin cross-linking factor 1-like isoform X5 [Pomacea canaliculata]